MMETKKTMDNRKKERTNYKRRKISNMEECNDVGKTFSAVSCLSFCPFLCLFTVISCLFVPHLSGHFIINRTTEPRPSQEPLQVCVFSVKMKPHKSFCACVALFFFLFFTILAKS